MLIKLISYSTLLAATCANHATPSSLLQISSQNRIGAQPSVDSFLNSMQKDVEEFQRKMDSEVRADEDQVHKMVEQQRKLEREEKSFRAKLLANVDQKVPSPESFIESSTHFGDPYIDEAMRVIGNEIDSQKRELERVISRHDITPSALVEQKAKRPELGLIADAIKTRLNMVGSV
jgi:hypothetical protein